jgi:small-conductance mechanosensitive channel
MIELPQQAASLSLLAKCIFAVVGILVIYTTFRVLENTLPRRFRKADARYRVRKFLVFSGYFTTLLFLAILFEDRLGRLSFALGIAGAGLAVALQDVVASIAGAFAIGFANLYAVGDRVQIGDTRGDVIDIGLLRTTIMETGNWVRADLYNGRIARIPNSVVLKGSVFNYSQGFQFVWDEIKVVLSATSDCQLARDIFMRLAKEAVGEYRIEAQTSWKEISDNYRSVNPPLEPTVALVVDAGSFEFTVSYVVDYTKRTAMKDKLFTKIVEEVTKSEGRLQWSSSAITVINQLAGADGAPAGAAVQATANAATAQPAPPKAAAAQNN